MRPFAIAALLSLAFATSAEAGDHKRDIRGFYVGMPQSEFEQHLKTIDCKISKDMFGDTDCWVAHSDVERYVFRLTHALNENVLQKVLFNFQSGLSPVEMIDQVSSQFGAKPEKFLDLILSPEPFALDNEFVRSTDHDQYNNMWLAQWRLHDQTETILILRGAVGKYASSQQGQYSLTILSDFIVERDNKAAEQKREMDLRQRLDNNPKF